MRRSALAGPVQIILVNGTRFVKHQVYEAKRTTRLNATIDNPMDLQREPTSHSSP